MTPQASNEKPSAISFLNRAHVVLVAIDQTQIVITTVLGTKITIPTSAATSAKFADELTGDVNSNFVSIASRVLSSTAINPTAKQ